MIFTKKRTMKSFHELDVTILAKELTPYTTSDKAGGEDRCNFESVKCTKEFVLFQV